MAKVNKQAIAAAFGRAATTYEQYADLQRISGERLLALAGDLPRGRLLDAGCGTGWFSRIWQQRGQQVIALDLSSEMLAEARRLDSAAEYLCGDIESLTLESASVETVWSNLAVQWCGDLCAGLGELRRVTRPGGRVLFSTLLADSLGELRQAWRAVDAQPHANRFLTLQQVQEACRDWPVALHEQTVTLVFPDVLSAMRSLKGIGATHLHQGRQTRTLTRRQLTALSLAWPQREGAFLLSYHLLYGVMDCD
ncbi:malonyl-ACP O-methyltransferase BioC [Entomohabitans teleogrylli]|uniref:malonyl-ACP O-methyltransferase BioC n=1 Tax=Entomohabitans teleogrylli TaxID=1384589 RepID=UPI00073D7431|nr:malonyl-ACP O-methyltransferase BioC [Entomohabitans teleogrylli]